ncbi:MAG: hypothetical protein AAF542_13820 [Pseudomonadota bacterium]
MSLLLDALNKTSGQTKPAEQQTPDLEHNHPAEAAVDRSAAPATSPLELTLEEQDQSHYAEPENEAVASQAQEIDVDIDINEAEFSALLEDSDDLSSEVQHAANEATLEGDAASALDSIDRISEEISVLPSIPSLANRRNPPKHADDAELGWVQTPAEPDSLTAGTENATPNIDVEIESAEPASEVSAVDSNGHLIIESQAERESLAEEVLQDAPLVQAYSQAQKKRHQILLLVIVAIVIAAAVAIYELVLDDTSVHVNANIFDPVTQQISGDVHNSVVLEEVHTDSIPERLNLPEFSSTTDATENIVLVAPPQEASIELRRAYTALKQGRLEQAIRLYTALSDTELHKVAALSGLASIAIEINDTNTARKHLQHVLSVDRHNTWAVATLAALPAEQSSINLLNSNSLSQLKSLRTADPNNHQIAYLLGNKFAAAGVWTEAQAAYFDAFSVDSRNANYAFNLAIALDHLGKSKQATDFYIQALQLAETRGADFNIALLRKRLQRGVR